MIRLLQLMLMICFRSRQNSFKIKLTYFVLCSFIAFESYIIFQSCQLKTQWRLSESRPGAGFSCCIKDPLVVAFGCIPLFGPVVVSLTHSPFSFRFYTLPLSLVFCLVFNQDTKFYRPITLLIGIL